MDDAIYQHQKSPSASLTSPKGSRDIPNARIERGECPDCGLKTHRIGRFKKLKPLTVPGYVLNGICLLCNPLIAISSKVSNRHRIEKIMTDGEGSLVSALTFGPNDHSFEADNTATDNGKKSNQELPLMRTEICEIVDEDDVEEGEVYHPTRSLTIEEAMERGTILAEEEELSVRFSPEDMRKMKVKTSCYHVEAVNCDEMDGKMSATRDPEREYSTYHRTSTIIRKPLHTNFNEPQRERGLSNESMIEEIDSKKNQTAKRLSTPESAFQERMLSFVEKNPDFAHSHLPSPKSRENDTVLRSIQKASIGRSNTDGNKLIQNKLKEFLTTREQTEASESFPSQDILKRSQSEGAKNMQKKYSTYLNSTSLEYPDIPPPPFPDWEMKMASMPPVLTRLLSENTCTSNRATYGVSGLTSFDKSNGLPSFDQINVSQDDGNVSAIDAFDDQSGYSSRDFSQNGRKMQTQLKRSRTAPVGPVGKEAVSTGLKKMVSFHQSKTGSMELDGATNSSFGSDVHSKSSHLKGRLQPILRNKSVDSRSTNSLRKNFTQAIAHEEDSATSISERVKKMRDEDESFIARKMKEISEFDCNDDTKKPSETLREKKVLKARLTQLGSSTSRDLDHAFVDYQLRQLNGNNVPQQSSIPYSDLRKDSTANNLSTFFKQNNLSHIQGPMNFGIKSGQTSRLDPNRASLISDDDDSELLMTQTLLGLNDRAHGNDHDSFNRPTLIVNSHAYSSRKPDYYASPQNNLDQGRPSDTAGNVNRSSYHNDFHIQSTTSRNDPQKLSPVEKNGYQYRSDDEDVFAKDINKPSRENPSSTIVKKLIDSNSSPRDSVPLLIRLMSNRVSKLDAHSNLLALDCIRVKGVKKEVKDVIFESQGVKAIVETMWSNLEDSVIQIAACQALWTISTDCNDLQRKIFVEVNAAEAIICCIQGHLDHVDLLSMACGVLGSFCLHEDTFNLMSMGIIMLISSIMKLHPHRAALQIWCIRLLWALSKNDKSGERIMELEKADCITLTCKAMCLEAHRETLEWGCRFLASISRNYVVASKMIDKYSNDLKIAFQPLELDDFDHNLVFALLSNLANTIEGDCTEIGETPIEILIKNTVSVMRANASDEDKQVYGCSVLSKFAEEKTASRLSIIACDGLKVAYNAMKYFPDNQKIEENAYFVLYFCSECSEGRLSFSYDMILYLVRRLIAWQYSENKQIIELIYAITASLSIEKQMHSTILSSGVITVTIDVMFHHSNEPSIQESACIFLRNLSRSKSMFDDLLNAGAVQCLISAMTANQNVLTIQESACVSLWNFSTGSKHRTSVVLEHGGIVPIIAAMQSHDQSDHMQEIACGTLWCLITNGNDEKYNCKSMIGTNGVDAIICAMFTYPHSAAILQNACGAISALSADASLSKTLVLNGGIDALIETMRGNLSNLKILEFGCICLRNIIIWNAVDDQNIAGIVHVILRCMRQYPEEINIQRHACCSLWSLNSSPLYAVKSKHEVLAGGGMDLIMTVLANTHWDIEIQREAREALETLIT